MTFPVPGAEFLERRLARATAVPPAERTPEVAAFVEAMRLLREARDLLPLTDGGEAALPDTLETRRKVCELTSAWLRLRHSQPAVPCQAARTGCPC